jgi:hypothetical protein
LTKHQTGKAKNSHFPNNFLAIFMEKILFTSLLPINKMQRIIANLQLNISYMQTLSSKISMGIFSLLLASSAFFMLTSSNFARYETLDDVLQDILAKLNAFTLQTPEDKVYIHSDKPFYKPGETMWFAVYVRNGKDLKPFCQ